MTDVTQILSQIEAGDPSAAEQLLPLVYDELRKLAAARLAREKPGQTLQATALVHQAYVRLVDQRTPQQWDNRRHFFAAAAEAMRRILIENARRKACAAHGGGYHRIELPELVQTDVGNQLDLIALDEALSKLELHAPEKALVVKIRFYVGLSLEETSDLLGISRATTQRYWTYARAWLYGTLRCD